MTDGKRIISHLKTEETIYLQLNVKGSYGDDFRHFKVKLLLYLSLMKLYRHGLFFPPYSRNGKGMTPDTDFEPYAWNRG
ncbi:hypothetical protein [Enterovibrio paralichthyis]|uniref:hypothetical protein n=1 Tax=Enterovibrio paralichthyis TaxID=2853805 RepID=UPI001C448CB2|nr:hypothetical protein [Enterovibrio paralichthyis]MBV7300491.1 hypothetical protein [Enterovibrio paralichthyis]